VSVAARGRALAEPGDRDALLLADSESERAADRNRQHRRQVADHREQAEVRVRHVHVAVPPARRPVLASHVLGEDPPRLDAARDVDPHVAVQRRADVVPAHRGRDSDRRRLVPAAGVERAGDLALLVEDVAALLDAARDQHVAVDRQQVLAVETCFADLVQGADRLGFARDRHARRTLTTRVAGAAQAASAYARSDHQSLRTPK
jgi:hypothetical protein